MNINQNVLVIKIYGLLTALMPMIAIIGLVVVGATLFAINSRIEKVEDEQEKERLLKKKKNRIIVLIIFGVLLGISLFIIPIINVMTNLMLI